MTEAAGDTAFSMKHLITIQGALTVSRLSGIVLLLALAVSSCTQRADPKVSQLLSELGARDWQVRRDAAEALGGITPASSDTIGALEEALRDYDSRVRRSAAGALGRIGPEASGSVPLLIDLLSDIDVGVVQAAAWALGQVGDPASSAVPTLTKLLTHGDADLRGAAADAIGRIGPRAEQSASSLAEALKDADPQVRASAALALGRVGPKSEDTATKLMQLMDDEDPLVRESTTEALGQLGEPAVAVLVGALNRGNPIFLHSAVDALGKIGPPAVPLLVEALNDGEQLLLVRRYAALALAKITVPPLVDRLDDELVDIRMSAAEALGKIGPDAVAAIPKLIELTQDRREAEVVREYAIVAMSRIAPRDEVVVATLVDAVGDGNPRIFEAAVAALLSTKLSQGSVDGAGQSVRALIEQLDQGDPQTREAAALGLGAMGPGAAESVPALTRVLADQANESGLRTAAAMALGLVGLEAEPAVPALTATLKSTDPNLRRASLVALKRIGPQTKTIPALLEAMQAGDFSIRGPASASVQTFAKARMQTWEPMLYQSDAPVLRNWLTRHEALYGVSAGSMERDSR
jgi:HEAT repeat protein